MTTEESNQFESRSAFSKPTHFQSKVALINKKLNLIIMPTEGCNFRCIYCYEDFKIGAMSKDVVDAIKSLLRARGPELNCLNISWFGGEPLLAYDNLVEIMNFIANELPKPADCTVTSDMTTNGYLLTIQRLGELVKLGVRTYQISFDGESEEHNKLRVLQNGFPTFDKIWSNLMAAHTSELDFTIVVRIHANLRNERSVRLLLRNLSTALGGDDRFRVFIRPLSRLGGINDDNLPVLDQEDLGVVPQLRRYAAGLGLIVNNFNGFDYVCYAAKFNSFVIRADGRVGKCTVALYDDRNFVGRLMSDGRMIIDQKKALWWSRGSFSNNKDELSCPLVGYSNEWTE